MTAVDGDIGLVSATATAATKDFAGEPGGVLIFVDTVAAFAGLACALAGEEYSSMPLVSIGVLAADAKGVVDGVVVPEADDPDADGCDPMPAGGASGI